MKIERGEIMNGEHQFHKMDAIEQQKTVYDVSLGIQAVMGYVGPIQFSSALKRYGFDDDCTTCSYKLGMAEGALIERGNVERDECFGYLSVR